MRISQNLLQARSTLRGLLPEGATAYTITRTVSRSGMLRRVSVLMVTEGRISDITGLVALALDWNRDKAGTLPIKGCGFSVATHVVGALSWALHGDEYKLLPQTL